MSEDREIEDKEVDDAMWAWAVADTRLARARTSGDVAAITEAETSCERAKKEVDRLSGSSSEEST